MSFASLLSFLFAGCTTGPDYVRPEVAVPAAWSTPRAGGEVNQAVAVTEWWTTLNDPVLNDLVERSVAANHDLRIAEARVREARAARGFATAAFWPTLSANAVASRTQIAEQNFAAAGGPPVTLGASADPAGISRSVTIRGQNLSVTRSVTGGVPSTSVSLAPGGGGGGIDRTNNFFQLGFDAAWELDVFGGNRRALEAADADIEGAVETRRDVLVSLLSEVALNYIELRSAQNRLDILNQNILAQKNTVELTGARFEAGLTSELDTVRAQALLAELQSNVPRLQTQVETSIHRLGVLIGHAPGELGPELSPSAALPAAPAEVPVGLPSDLLRRRPDIRAAEREVAAATARIGEAMADLFPKFFLTGGISGQGSVLGDVFQGGNQLWSIGPGISWPILQGGRIRANIEVQNARQEQAAINYERSILLALEDVENGLVSFAKEQDRRASLEAAVAANQAAVRLANERYVNGLENFLDVLQAQQQLFQSQDELVQSQSFVLTNLIALYKALGGGWETSD
ncbi:MAG: efflux transporter outer membrane subunit [Candidatus Hydrogenedentes bacterium]|nr:efflux transporter outer membrane subunit [Candidatus Hydrogenedentota bacterium]